MKKEKNKTNKVLIILGILIGILSLLGLSYAIWVLKLKQTNPNLVKSSCLKLSLTNEKNDINIENAYPLLNEEGKSLTPYEFTIENTCDLFVSYSVNLEVLDETTLPIKYVSVLLNEEGVQRLSSFDTVESTLKNISISKELYKGGIGAGETNNYKLRLWLSEDVGPEDTDAMNKIFTSKVTVTASAGIYDPLKQGYDKISDAILANEYQTSPEISKQKIATKQSPDFTKTAPLIIWNENISDSLKTVTATMPHPDLVALKDTDERFKYLTNDNVLLTIGTGYVFNKDTGNFNLLNTTLIDPTTINYSDGNKYYYCKSYFTTNADEIINISHAIGSCSSIYELTSATKADSSFDTLAGNKFKAQTFRMQATEITQKESESDKSDKGLYQIADDDGISYYYRGSVNNNYVKFAGYNWQIIRINGDGSIRLLYADNNKSDNIGNSLFNKLRNNPAYAGFMYGNTLNVSYEKAIASEQDSDVKMVLDKWYKENILGTSNESLITDTGFCNNRSIASGNGYSDSATTRYSQNFLYQSTGFNLTCPQQQDLFTLSSNKVGNKALTYPIGLITTDELVLAGLNSRYLNRLSYVYSTNRYWSMSPYAYNADSSALSVYGVIDTGSIAAYWVDTNLGVRPVINIRGDSKISGGIGTKDNPYQISVG